MDPEFLKALELVAEYDRNRPNIVKENRLYYHEDGSIIGLWDSDFPEGNYIELTDLTLFTNSNSHLLRVINGKLTKIDPTVLAQTRLIKSITGQPVVAGHAALALMPTEEYSNIEYYDRNN